MNKTILYRNSKIGISRWTIYRVSDHIIAWESESKIGDSVQQFTEKVEKGLAGRTLDQQVELRMKARIRGKKDAGYVDTIEEAQNADLKNTLGLYQPMLAQKLKDIRNFKIENYFAQPKLDGHRCLITREGNEIIAYSRRGREIHTIPHITSKLLDRIPDGTTLDGELYAHNVPLQTIASWARRNHPIPESRQLQYIVFDVVESDTPYEERVKILWDDLNLPYDRNHEFYLLDTIDMANVEWTLEQLFKVHRGNNYEGTILRNREFPYEIGRRSKGLVKVKEFHDDEFEVVDVIPSKWNWGVLVCKLPTGATFKVAAPGTISEKEKVLQNKQAYIGNHVTVEYAHLTKDKVPFHPVATRWRLDL